MIFNKKILYIKDNNFNYVNKVLIVKEKRNKAVMLLYTSIVFPNL